jgi:hypothetical protein
MAIFSDGTTDITVKYVDEIVQPQLDRSVKTSSSGKIKTQTAGERLKFTLRFRETGANARTLIDLLNNGADEYYYTNEDTHSFYTDKVTWPLNVVFTNWSFEFDSRTNYIVNLEMMSVDYL